MKILFVIDDLYSGGAQRQMVKLAIALKDDGHDISVLTYFDRDFYGDTLKNSGIESICIPNNSPIKRILAFRQFIRKGNYALVISYLGVPNFLSELASIPAKNWKLVVNERSANPDILKSFKSIFIRFFHLFADLVLANSFANKEIVQKANPILSHNKVKVIYNMIDLNEWKPLSEFRFKKNGKITLLVAASHRYLKNFLGLLQAINLLDDKEREKIYIEWYGNNLTPPYYDESINDCRKYINEKKLGNLIELFPATLDIKLAMQQADVIGLFSFFEGLPNAVCEGMALGKPIIASNISDIPKLLTDNINGKLIDPNSPESIAEGLRFFIHSSDAALIEMGCKSRLKAEQLFDQEKIIASYKDLLK